MKTLFRFFTTRHLLANALTVMILLGGFYSLSQINREEFPNTDTGIVTVKAGYNGAAAEDVELQVTNALEDALNGVVGIKSMSSTSRDGSVMIKISVDEDADSDDVYADIIDAIAGVKGLPADADTPTVSAMNPAMKSVMRFGISSGTLTYAELRDYVHQLEKKLLALPGVAQISLGGYLDREVRIEVSPDDLVRYGLSMSTISQAIATQNVRTSSGSIDTDTEQKNVITYSLFDDTQDVGEVIVLSYASGGVVRVKDVATITDGFEEQKTLTRINGQTTIQVTVTKDANADIIRTAEAVKTLLTEEQASLPPDTVNVLMLSDDSLKIEDKFNIVMANGLAGLLMVLLVLAAFLSLHTAFWVAIGIPVSLMGVMVILPLLNIELDSVTMSAMVLVIGIIVDDAIVIAENIFQHRERGKKPLEAAVDGLAEVAMPVFTTIMTTFLAFIPMLFVKGMMGMFLFVVPLTVIAALSTSMLESYFILPAHLLPGLQSGKKKPVTRGWFRPIRNAFESLLRRHVLPLRYVWVFVACMLLAGTLYYASTSMRFLMFARGKSTTESIDLTLELPTGTPLETTSAAMEELEAIAATFPKTEVAAYMTSVGSGGMRGVEATNMGMLTLYLPLASEMTRSATVINQELLAKTSHIEGLTSGRTFRGFSSGSPVEIQVKGGDTATRSAAVENIMTYLESIDGVSGLERDDTAGKDELRVYPDHSMLARYGLTVKNISQGLKSFYDGEVSTTLRYGDEEIDFLVVLDADERERVEYIQQVKIINNQGESINLGEVATFETRPALYALYHEDGEPTITISGDTDEDLITPLEVMTLVEEHFSFEKMREYPGIRLDIGGEAAESKQAIFDILVSFAFAGVGIYFLLMILFESLTQPLIVLMTIPCGVMGVVLAFMLHGITQFTFFAGIGVVGLAGVVVNDALVMVAHLNALRREYKGRDTTIVSDEVAVIAEGVANRLRPVVLTTITTVAGLLPLTYGIGGYDDMMAPMAMTMGYGLLFATPITLILLPSLYLIRSDIEMGISRLFRRQNTKQFEQELQTIDGLVTEEIA